MSLLVDWTANNRKWFQISAGDSGYRQTFSLNMCIRIALIQQLSKELKAPPLRYKCLQKIICCEPASRHAHSHVLQHWSTCRRRAVNQRKCWSAERNPSASTKALQELASVPPPPHEQPLCLSADSVKRTLAAINTRKATGPDNIPGRALKDCAEELKDVFTDIFNTSLKQAIVPSCFKAATIIPVPKKTAPSCFNDCGTDTHHHEVLWAAYHVTNQIHSPPHPGPLPVRIPCQTIHRGCNLLCPPPSPHPPGKKRLICQNAVYRLQFCIQHHNTTTTHLQTWQTGTQYLPLQLATGLPLSEASNSMCWQQHLKQHHTEHRGPPRLRAQSPALHPTDAWLHYSLQQQSHSEICWRHNSGGSHHQGRWDSIQDGGRPSDHVVQG